MLKKIKSLKLKRSYERKGKMIINSYKSELTAPKIVLKFFSKVHTIERYEEETRIS